MNDKRPYRLHEDWCHTTHDDCCGEQECDCLMSHIKARIDAVTWANEEWDEVYRMGYNKALTRVWAALGDHKMPTPNDPWCSLCGINADPPCPLCPHYEPAGNDPPPFTVCENHPNHPCSCTDEDRQRARAIRDALSLSQPDANDQS